MEAVTIFFLWLLTGFFAVWNICLHCVGVYLLKCLRRNGEENVEQLYLISLGFAAIGYNVVAIVSLPLKMYIVLHEKSELYGKSDLLVRL